MNNFLKYIIRRLKGYKGLVKEEEEKKNKYYWNISR